MTLPLPEHLRAAIESSQCPSNLSPLERVVWATERRKRYEAGEIEVVQPRITNDLKAPSAEADSE